MVQYSHLFKNFPFFVIHTLKGFSVVYETETRMFFWNYLAFSMIQQMLAVSSLVSLPFLNPACTSGLSWLMYCWSLAWRILSMSLLSCEMNTIDIALLWTGMVIDLFQSCGLCWFFQICWHIEWSISTASSFRILKSSVGIPSPPLALFVVVMFPKAHLTSHSRMSGFRWVSTPVWLSRLLNSFFV